MSTQRICLDGAVRNICSDGELCFRTNLPHLENYEHPHLSDILEQGKDPETNKFHLPDVCVAREKVINQLHMLERIIKKREKDADVIVIETHQETVDLTLDDSMPEDDRPPAPTVIVSPAPKRIKTESGQTVADKIAAAAPYNLFLVTIPDLPLTHNEPLSLTFIELLDPSLGQLESSIQINFVLDMEFVMRQYRATNNDHLPLIVVNPEYEGRAFIEYPNVTCVKSKMVNGREGQSWGCPHAKMMLFFYTDGSMRVVVSTANAYNDCWFGRTQGLWISPRLPPATDADSGESVTNFRADLVLYLRAYASSVLEPFIDRIGRSDFSAVKVFFIASAPNHGHRVDPARGPPFGIAKLEHLLRSNGVKPPDDCPLVAQASTMGELGVDLGGWISTDFLKSTAPGAARLPPFKLIYPSRSDVARSIDGGSGLLYRAQTDSKQPWLKKHLFHWRAAGRHRTTAMPHIKSYARWSSDEDGLYWFFLTSANLSRSAHGSFNKTPKNNPSLRLWNYEAGVLFLPQVILGTDVFPLLPGDPRGPAFPMPYDMELQPYGDNDTPFCN